MFESNEIRKKYGKYNEQIGKNELMLTLKPNKLVKYNNYYIEFRIDYKNRRTSLIFYDENKNYLEERGFIDFDEYKKMYEVKLKNLALVRASKKTINEDLYFRYYSIKCYKSKEFDIFLQMLENNDLTITIQLRFSKKNPEKNKSKNIIISIPEDNLEYLFELVAQYEI